MTARGADDMSGDSRAAGRAFAELNRLHVPLSSSHFLAGAGLSSLGDSHSILNVSFFVSLVYDDMDARQVEQ